MTVSELIQELSRLPPDAEVHYEYGYGDHWRTIVAPRVTSVEEGKVQYSDYHRMDRVITDYEKVYDSPNPYVVLLGNN